jgi:hypothetical protein
MKLYVFSFSGKDVVVSGFVGIAFQFISPVTFLAEGTSECKGQN